MLVEPHATSHPSSMPILESENAPVFPAAVTLVARDADALAQFYVETLGLAPIASDGTTITLGADNTGFLNLRRSPTAAPYDPRSAGLFHIAFLLPDRASLGRWYLGANAAKARFEGASDHRVSEAFYLTDPEGNGIEVYVDRPRAQWPRDSLGYAMTTGPMALPDLVREAGGGHAIHRLPAGTRIGHVHLQVGDTAKSAQFYQNALGMTVTHRRPQAEFLSWGGYHHHIGINSWNSRGSASRDPRMTGLESIAFKATRQAIDGLSLSSGVPIGADGSLAIEAPYGLRLSFKVA
ncbi:COG2514 Predicted ring-cleavage extradiol dioxygenase [Rhabdaerophilaceae bacterium]